MGTMLSDLDPKKFAPSALLKEDGASMVGVLKGAREIKTQFGPKLVYSFIVESATCRFNRGKEDVKPAKGEIVEVIPPTRLATQLAKAKAGDRLSIKYLGKDEKSKGAQKPHIFSVEVL